MRATTGWEAFSEMCRQMIWYDAGEDVYTNMLLFYFRYGEQSFMFGNIIKGVVEPFNTQYDYENVSGCSDEDCW